VRHKIVTRFWQQEREDFSLLEKLFFYFLCFLELFYKFGFYVVVFFKRRKSLKSNFRVLSIGNLSVGGTGKSVFTLFLTNRLSPLKAAIFIRGYKGAINKHRKSIVATRDEIENFDAHIIGDEAMMFLQKTSSPVVVGKDRQLSLRVLNKFCKQRANSIDCVLLDDGYQNYDLRKDSDILLLDSRAPFGNGHCLPAGPLRELDFSRADAIVLTHANEISHTELQNLKSTLDHKNIFAGRHAASRIDVQGPILAVAGIGSFSGFIYSIKTSNLLIKDAMQFLDHFSYDRADVERIIDRMNRSGCKAIVTTEKDWQKLSQIVGEHRKFFYVLKIKFEFLTEEDDSRFFDHVFFRNFPNYYCLNFIL
jgi:tetraacyldisaccharide 4'-kinase